MLEIFSRIVNKLQTDGESCEHYKLLRSANVELENEWQGVSYVGEMGTLSESQEISLKSTHDY